MVMHGGGRYEGKKPTLDRWIDTYTKMPKYISKRLVLENDER